MANEAKAKAREAKHVQCSVSRTHNAAMSWGKAAARRPHVSCRVPSRQTRHSESEQITAPRLFTRAHLGRN